MKNLKSYSIAGIIISLIGLVISFLLVREFYGNAGDLVSSLCSATGAEGGCEKVKNSSFSSFSIPVLGSYPIALLGFMFYGFTLTLFGFSITAKEDTTKQGIFSVILGIAGLGLLIDLTLLIISLSVIGAVCSLCVATYFVTLGILVISYLAIKAAESSKGVITTMKEKIFPTIKTNLLTYVIIALGFFACGLGMGKSGNSSEKLVSTDDMIKAKIETFEKSPVLNLDTKDFPFAGDPKAPIVIVKYADYNCGHCMHTSHILHNVLAEFQGIVKVYYKDFPLDGNCNRLVGRKSPDASSCIASAAALCSYKQNKFYPIYQGLFANNENGVRHNAATVRELAERSGLNMQSFQSCMTSSYPQDAINKEVNEAETLNIQSTPSLYVNGKALDPGSPDPKFLRELLIHLSKKI